MNEIAKILNKPGSIAVIPTDTIYGVVARAVDQAATKRLYELKSRDNKPGTLIADSIDQLVDLGIKRRYLTAVEQFWPGVVSVIIPTSELTISYLHQGKMSLAIRIPNDKKLRELLKQTGPRITTSANPPGQPPADTIQQAKDYFGDHIDYYQDGGDLAGREPSTVIRIIDDAVKVLRQGAVKIDD